MTKDELLALPKTVPQLQALAFLNMAEEVGIGEPELTEEECAAGRMYYLARARRFMEEAKTAKPITGKGKTK